MSVSSVSLRYFLLGLLNQKPLSGYDAKRAFESLSWLVGHPSFGSLYPALHNLLEDNLVTVDVDGGEEGPSRKVYSITEAGRQELQEWVNQPAESNASMKAFVMRLMLADSFPPAGLITQLYQRRAQVTVHRDELEQATDENGAVAELQHLAADYGLTLATAELEWLDSVLERLSQQSPAAEGI